jgi:DNA primase large subunit
MHFTKVMSHDDFVKKYSYSFRHMYGKEGARKNYTPYSCMKIIMGTPPEPGAFHGCPYRHMDNVPLSALLSSLNIGGNDVREIVTLAKSSNYQVACQKHFDLTHPGHASMGLTNDVVANHPNQWFQASVQYHKAKAGGGAVAATAPAPSIEASSSSSSSASSSPPSQDSSLHISSEPANEGVEMTTE